MKTKSAVKYLFLVALFFAFAENTVAQFAAGKSKFLGNIGSGTPSSQYISLWNQITPENASKWASCEKKDNTWSFNTALSIYGYCQSSGMPFKFHTLVWGMQYPSWVDALATDSLKKVAVEDWITEAGQTFPNATYVDVVNEALNGHQPPKWRTAIGGSNDLYGTGWDWVVWSFEKARIAFPHSKLLINDYDILNNSNNVESYCNIINILMQRGLVDGIGCQGHFLEGQTGAAVKTRLDRIAERCPGIPIYISELDINIADDTHQKNKLEELFTVIWNHAAVKGITFWGYTSSWLGDGALLIRNGIDRPAMAWLRSYVPNAVLDEQAPAIPTGLNASDIFSNGFILNWAQSSDNVGVERYDVYVDGLFYASTAQPSLPVTALQANRPYSLTIKAKDTAGNFSEFSQPLVVTTAQSGTYSWGIFTNEINLGDAAGLPGSAYENNGTYIVDGGGYNFGVVSAGQSDALYFLYKKIIGNATIIAKVESVEALTSLSKGGIMMRENLNGGSKYISLNALPASKMIEYRKRITTDSANYTTGYAVGYSSNPVWLKLQRTGNTFTRFVSTDGLSWDSPKVTSTGGTLTIDNESNQNLVMNDTAYVGLFSCSKELNSLGKTLISEVSLLENNTTGIKQNPVKDICIYAHGNEISIDLSAVKGPSEISIYDLKGTLIKQAESNGSEIQKLKLRNKGLYVIRVQNQWMQIAKKVVIN